MHTYYSKYCKKWETMRDIREGEDQIHAKGERYLPRLLKQTDAQYLSYVQRSEFFNATDRTIAGMLGLSTRKGVIITGIEDFSVYEEDISQKGQSLAAYTSTVLDEQLTVGRGGTLVDYPELQEPVTQAQMEQQEIRPRFVYYKAENIVDWAFDYIGGKYQPIEIKLREYIDNQTGQGIEKDVQYRYLALIEGIYYQWIENESGSMTKEQFTPTKLNGDTFNYIPFVFHTQADSGDVVLSPPLYNLATLNIKHYQLKADQAHGLLYVSLPTPWVAGVSSDEKPTTIGPQHLWFFTSPNVKAGMLEFSGAGLESIAREIESKEKRMAALGAQVIYGSDVTMTATEASINYQSETSVLSTIIKNTNSQLSKALSFLFDWINEDMEDFSFLIPIDFMPLSMTPNKILALVRSWLDGAISRETMYWNFKQGEIMPTERTTEEEVDLIDTDRPIANPE